MRQRVISIATALLVVSAAACVPDETGDGDGSDAWTVDTGAEDTGEDDTGAVDTGMDVAVDTAPRDTSEDTTELGDTSDPDTTDTGDRDVVDTGVDTGWPRDAFPKKFGSGSFVRHLYIDKKNPSTPRCCFDYDSDSANDNAVAEVIASIMGFSVKDANMNINGDIQSGNFIYLFEYNDWKTSGWRNDGSITMTAHPGKDAMSPFSDNLNGNGTFEIRPISYKSNGQPQSQFKTASVSSRNLTAEDGTLVLPLSFGQGVSVTLTVNDPDLTATVKQGASVGPGGTVALESGKMGGIITKEDFYGSINDACKCPSGERIERSSPSSETWQCNTSGNCSCNPFLLATSFACNEIQSAVSSNADVDRDSDGTNDALSFGASFDAVGAEIVGIAP